MVACATMSTSPPSPPSAKRQHKEDGELTSKDPAAKEKLLSSDSDGEDVTVEAPLLDNDSIKLLVRYTRILEHQYVRATERCPRRPKGLTEEIYDKVYPCEWPTKTSVWAKEMNYCDSE